MANKTEYILFLDETDSTKYNKYFCLAGFIISRQEYEEFLIPKINSLKTEILQSPHIVFHYKDIRQSAKEFRLLKNKTIRESFWNNICDIISESNITTIASYIDAKSFRENYPKDIALSQYHVLFYELINSYTHFLISNNGFGSVMLESRDPKQNHNMQDLFYNFTQVGTNLYLPTTIREYIFTLNFNIKKDNCIGLQIADMIPLAFVRNLNGDSNPYNLYNVLSSKLYKGCQSSSDGYGLIKILR